MYTYICIYIIYLWSYILYTLMNEFILICVQMQGVKVKILAPEKHLFKYGNKIVLHYFQPLPRGDSARNRLYARAPKRELEELLRRALRQKGNVFFVVIFFSSDGLPRQTGSGTWHDMFFSSRSVFQLNMSPPAMFHLKGIEVDQRPCRLLFVRCFWKKWFIRYWYRNVFIHIYRSDFKKY